MGTCHLLIEYYRALKKNVVANKLNKSPKKLEHFVQKLKRSAPLVRQTGKMSKKDKRCLDKMLLQIHKTVIKELSEWIKKNRNKNSKIIPWLNSQIKRHHNMITNMSQFDQEKPVKLKELAKKRFKRSRKDDSSDEEDEDEEDYDSDFNTDDMSEEEFMEEELMDDDEDEDSESESENEDSESESESENDDSESESESDDSESESESEGKHTKKRRKLTQNTRKEGGWIKKNGKWTKCEDTDEDTKKFKEYLKERDQTSFQSKKAHIETFKKLSKFERKKILSQISKSKEHTNCPIIYRIMLSNIPQNSKNDIVSRLESLEKNEDECPKYREYVNTALKIPFGIFVKSKVNSESKTSEIRSFINRTEQCMNQAVHGHENAKQQILQFVAQNISNPSPKGLVLGIEGPMGNGKTTLIENGFAKALGRPFATIPLGGVQDGSFLEGHGYTYEGSRWGQIVNVLIKAKCMNPIIYMDELDKVSRTAKGDEINNLLIHLIDPSQNHHFRDKYFADMDIDLSQVIFIFSYNDRDAINPVLMDRITHLKTKGFRLPQKVVISKNFLLKNIMEDVGVREKDIIFKDDVLEWIIQSYTHEGGVRNLKKICYEIVREVNLRNLTNKGFKYPYTVTREVLEDDILNLRIPYKHDKIHSAPMVGKINGLYATCNDTGGITQIEAVWLPTDCNLKLELTGHQGKVMQESMHVAKTLSWSLLTDSSRNELKDQWKQIGHQGIHVHCPEGATPKDGPSAGAAITTAMYSLLSGKKIRNDIAITGEIDLSGKIMEIGGLESKIFGAKMAGCKKVLCPKDNLPSLQRIIDEHPDIMDENFQVKIVSNIHDVFKVMLE